MVAVNETEFPDVGDAYGNTIIFTGPQPDNKWFTDDDTQSSYGANGIIHCCYRYDAETENYYVRNRYYSPTLGRWIQRDPIGYAGGIDLYEYVAERAVVAADRSGLPTEADCETQLNKCVDTCWNRRPTPYPWRRDKWYYDHCQEVCNGPYLDCLDRLKPAECPSPLPAIDVVGEAGATAAAGAEEISVGDIVIEVVIGTALF